MSESLIPFIEMLSNKVDSVGTKVDGINDRLHSIHLELRENIEDTKSEFARNHFEHKSTLAQHEQQLRLIKRVGIGLCVILAGVFGDLFSQTSLLKTLSHLGPFFNLNG